MKILALVVTHNRLALLKRCIKGLQEQSLKPDILIINNASTDGTEKFLVQEKIDHVTQENLGSAGGWYKGIEEGWGRGYDYIWMMDDDGFPDKPALERLVANLTPETICISSLLIKENDHSSLVFGMPVMNKRGFPVILAARRKLNSVQSLGGEKVYPHAHLFNGALINLEMVRGTGNVDTSYFMYGDEVDYYYRMRKKGKIATVVDALHFHPDVSGRSIDKKKVYYFIRNTIIINHVYCDKPFIRDFFTVGVAFYRILRRNGFLQFLSYLFGSNAKFFYPAVYDGYKKRKINRFV